MQEYYRQTWLTYNTFVWSSLMLAQLLPQRLTSLEVRGTPYLERPLLNFDVDSDVIRGCSLYSWVQLVLAGTARIRGYSSYSRVQLVFAGTARIRGYSSYLRVQLSFDWLTPMVKMFKFWWQRELHAKEVAI